MFSPKYNPDQNIHIEAPQGGNMKSSVLLNIRFVVRQPDKLFGNQHVVFY